VRGSLWRLTTVGAAFASTAVPRTAGAEPRSPSAAEECECRADPGERLHDGFFARSESGVALLSAHVAGAGRSLRQRIRGVGQSAGLSLGDTPAKGLVVGGTLWTVPIDPVFVEGGNTVTPDDDSVKVTLLRLGPFVDWYPRPREGFHALSSVAFTVQIESDVKGNAVTPAALGWSVSTGLGYEWFLASEVSLGFLGRVTFGSLERAVAGGPEMTLFALPELGLAGTYH
jgi:hypothetical protein